MSKVRLTNDLYPYLQLTLTTGDRSKGCYYVGLKKGESVEVEETALTDQVKGLLKRKPPRLKMESFTVVVTPLNPVVAQADAADAVVSDPVPESVAEDLSFECPHCPAKFRSEKKFEKHVSKHVTAEAEKPADEPLNN